MLSILASVVFASFRCVSCLYGVCFCVWLFCCSCGVGVYVGCFVGGILWFGLSNEVGDLVEVCLFGVGFYWCFRRVGFAVLLDFFLPPPGIGVLGVFMMFCVGFSGLRLQLGTHYDCSLP